MTVAEPLRFAQGVTLVGGGRLTRDALEQARGLAPHLVAADGGADALLALGAAPEAVIGDLDSVQDLASLRSRGARIVEVAEQDSTDFEKCLIHADAPFFIGVGFLGRRFDHTLAALHALLAHPSRPILLLGEEDVVFLAPQRWRIDLAIGARVSFFPLGSARGLCSRGLVWPLDGLDFAPGRRIGTSNRAAAARVEARFDSRAMLAILPRRWLGAALRSLTTHASTEC